MISIRAETHAKVREYCLANNISIAAFIDTLCVKFLSEGIVLRQSSTPSNGPLFAPEERSKLFSR